MLTISIFQKCLLGPKIHIAKISLFYRRRGTYISTKAHQQQKHTSILICSECRVSLNPNMYIISSVSHTDLENGGQGNCFADFFNFGKYLTWISLAYVSKSTLISFVVQQFCVSLLKNNY